MRFHVFVITRFFDQDLIKALFFTGIFYYSVKLKALYDMPALLLNFFTLLFFILKIIFFCYLT